MRNEQNQWHSVATKFRLILGLRKQAEIEGLQSLGNKILILKVLIECNEF